ncbi:hypothetical protein JOM56_001140 [Amanita muscaria]
MSASNLILTLLILQTIFLLEPIVLLLFLRLLTYSLITGTPLETILRNITVLEDDILLPYPPGFLNASDCADFGGDVSTCAADLDMSATSSFDYSLSSMIDLEISCSVPTVASGSAIYLLDASSEHKFDLGPAEVVLECSSSNKACITSVFQSPGSSKVLNISEQKSTTSSSQPTTSMCHTELIAVEVSPATSCTQQRSSKCLAQSIGIPADLDERPVFSRHIATGNVIFPVRKPPADAVSKAPHDPFDINSLLKRMPASWAQKHRRDVPKSLRIAMSGVMDSSVFRRERKPAVVAGCDAYDSWPYIRTEVEQDIEDEREKAEEDTFVSVLKWAFHIKGFFKYGILDLQAIRYQCPTDHRFEAGQLE